MGKNEIFPAELFQAEMQAIQILLQKKNTIMTDKNSEERIKGNRIRDQRQATDYR